MCHCEEKGWGLEFIMKGLSLRPTSGGCKQGLEPGFPKESARGA